MASTRGSRCTCELLLFLLFSDHFAHSRILAFQGCSRRTRLPLEPANCTLDLLRSLVSRPAGQALVPSTSLTDVPLDVRQATLTVRWTIEALLGYVTTQLLM
jgi:nuclear pore complex protein Nup188